MSGFGEQDFSQYPDREYQLGWLRNFLEFYYEETGRSASSVTDVDVERLYVQVNKFALVSWLHAVHSGCMCRDLAMSVCIWLCVSVSGWLFSA